MGEVKRIPFAELETLATILRTLLLGKQIDLDHRTAPDSASSLAPITHIILYNYTSFILFSR